MSSKTLAMRFLEGQKIDYEALSYPSEIKDAEEVAAQVGEPAGAVFKTLVVDRPPEKPLLALVPANRQLDLKKLARAVGAKKLSMASQSVAEDLTGLQVGGISPLALVNRGFKVYVDGSARQLDAICVSAGERGQQIKLAPRDLVRVTRARYADIAG
jgi:Cys-tRNA(Pro)/Cys-tRNA(Cys) deacylase